LLLRAFAREPSDDAHGTRKCVEILAVGIAHVSAIPVGGLDRRSTELQPLVIRPHHYKSVCAEWQI